MNKTNRIIIDNAECFINKISADQIKKTTIVFRDKIFCLHVQKKNILNRQILTGFTSEFFFFGG